MSNTGNVYGRPSNDPEETVVGGPIDFGNERPRLEDLPMMPPPPPSYVVSAMDDTMVDLPPQHFAPMPELGTAIRDEEHLREVITDANQRYAETPEETAARHALDKPLVDAFNDIRDSREQEPWMTDDYKVPLEFLPHNIFDLVTTTSFGIRYKTKNGSTYISRWFPLSEYEERYRRTVYMLEAMNDGTMYATVAVEEGVMFLNVAEIESFTFFSQQWYETEYQQKNMPPRGGYRY